VTREEVARVEKLIDEADRSQDWIPDLIRRIMRELPHLTARDIAEVARVQAETLRMKGAEIMASGEAAEQIGDIILETERLSGTAVPNLETALAILADRAAKGDQQAANLLEKFKRAALVMQLDSE
jgi:hypothetical protein